MIHHISLFKWKSKSGLRKGGVERFATYLDRAVGGGVSMWEFFDLPNWADWQSEHDFEKAKALSHWLWESGAVKENDVVVFDGYWGIGLVDKPVRAISVCHGSYIGTMIQMDKYPWQGEPYLPFHAQYQEATWKDPNCEVVAVSPRAAQELHDLYGVESTVILNGVDLEVYKPMPERHQDGLVLHAATGPRKGIDIMGEIAGFLKEGLRLEFLQANEPSFESEARRWSEGSLAVFPTRYEGCAYAGIECAACGVPQVHYATGQACSYDNRVGLVVDDLNSLPIAHHLNEMSDHLDDYNPHEWAREFADYERFAREWRNYLSVKE